MTDRRDRHRDAPSKARTKWSRITPSGEHWPGEPQPTVLALPVFHTVPPGTALAAAGRIRTTIGSTAIAIPVVREAALKAATGPQEAQGSVVNGVQPQARTAPLPVYCTAPRDLMVAGADRCPDPIES